MDTDTKPLDGYVRLITTTASMVLTVALLFITDPAKATTITQFWNAVLIPAIPMVANIIFVIGRTVTDMKKIEAKKEVALAVAAAPITPVPTAVPTQVPAPAVSSIAPAAEQQPQYKPVDVEAMVNAVEDGIRRDGLTVTDLNRAFYFYPKAANFDLRPVPRANRVEEATRITAKCLDLFKAGWKWYTKIDVPTPDQCANPHVAMLSIKKAFEVAAGVTCSNQTFEELKNLIGYFNDLYSAMVGLEQLKGKIIDWSVYGGSTFGPFQVGWDYAKFA